MGLEYLGGGKECLGEGGMGEGGVQRWRGAHGFLMFMGAWDVARAPSTWSFSARSRLLPRPYAIACAECRARSRGRAAASGTASASSPVVKSRAKNGSGKNEWDGLQIRVVPADAATVINYSISDDRGEV